ncbi:MAG: ANTAR domain-containing protein [Carbonactinosporaceae bacterium]
MSLDEPRGGEPPPEQLAKEFAQLARRLLSRESVQGTLDEIVHLAVNSVPGCDAAGVMVLHGNRRVESPAVSDPRLRRSDQAQFDLQEGPCLEAVWEGESYLVGDMTRETRWPRYVPAALDLGIRSMLGIKLFTREDTLGALDLYSWRAHAFGPRTLEVGWSFASHAAVALAAAQERAQLQEAIHSRHVIGEAMGLLMGRLGLTEEEAFDLLRTTSNEANIKLRDIARRIVEAGELPGGR